MRDVNPYDLQRADAPECAGCRCALSDDDEVDMGNDLYCQDCAKALEFIEDGDGEFADA